MHRLEILNHSLMAAKQRIEVGALYYHYRTPTKLYKVLTLALDEATDKPCVVYQALYGKQLIWVRSLDVWCDKMEHEGQIVPRFIKQELLKHKVDVVPDTSLHHLLHEKILSEAIPL